VVDAPDGSPALTQQQAMLLVEECFAREGVKLYKQSVKVDETGAYLELQFLTPALGRRHSGTLEVLARETGWRVGWSAHPRQLELIALARAPFDECRLGILKGPSVLPGDAVRVKLAGPLGEAERAAIQEQFRSHSGFELEIVGPGTSPLTRP
jgi:hypothetical protein